MKAKDRIVSCISCGKPKISKDEIGINLKLLGEKIESFYCLYCLADYLEVSVDDLKDKIDEFKEEGCKLFE